MAGGRYEITKNALGEYAFVLVTVSGKVLAHSGIYRSLGVCKKGIASMRINSDAPIEDKSDIFEKEDLKCPKIELFAEEAGGYNFALRAKNGNVIALGEGYGTKKRCLEAIASLKYIAFSAETYEKF